MDVIKLTKREKQKNKKDGHRSRLSYSGCGHEEAQKATDGDEEKSNWLKWHLTRKKRHRVWERYSDQNHSSETFISDEDAEPQLLSSRERLLLTEPSNSKKSSEKIKKKPNVRSRK